VITPVVLPWPLQSSLEAIARVLLEPGDRSQIDFSRPGRGCSSIARVRLLARLQEPALPFHRRRHRCDHGARRTACAHRRLGTHDFSSGSDPAAAQDRACRYGDRLRCPQHGRAHDSPHSTNT
jgi:hypothetical protein